MSAARHVLRVAALCLLFAAPPGLAAAEGNGMPEAAAFVPAAGGDALDLAGTLELALLSPRVALAELRMTQALDALAAAHAPFSAELRGGYTQTFRAAGASGSFDPLVLSATLNVFDAGPLAQQRAQAARQVVEAELALRDTRAQALIDAVHLYLQAVRAGQELELAGLRVQLAALQLEAATVQFDSGAAGEAQLASARLGLEQAVAARDAAVLRELQALAAIGTSLGAEVAAVTLADRLPSGICVPDAVAFDPTARLDVVQARHALDAARGALAAAERDVLPAASLRVAGNIRGDATSLGASADLSTRAPQPVLSLSFDPDPPVTQPQGTSVTVGVSVTVPLDGRVGSGIRSAELALEQAELQYGIAESQALLAVESTRHALLTAGRDAELAALAHAAASDAREAAGQRLDLGLVTELDVLQAEIALRTAELSLARAGDAELLAALDLTAALALDPAACLPAAAPIPLGGNEHD